jgi:hypothetical protein
LGSTGRPAVGENGVPLEIFAFTVFQQKLPAPFKICPPTALALLSPDEAEISIFPPRCGLSIPRYTTLEIMSSKLTRLAIDLPE